MVNFYIVFVKDGFFAIVSERDNSKYWSKMDKGWEIVWDSARSEKAGIEYAREHANAIPEGTKKCCCCSREMCKNTEAIGLAKGKKYYHNEERYRPFKGHVCEMHSEDIEGLQWLK